MSYLKKKFMKEIRNGNKEFKIILFHQEFNNKVNLYQNVHLLLKLYLYI